MDIKKEFVQVYGYCVEDGVLGDLEPRLGPATHILASTIRRVAVYKTFNHLCPEDDVRSIFRSHLDGDDFRQFWKKFCYRLCACMNFSCTCDKLMHGFKECTCDLSIVLPLVEVWTKTGKYFVFGDDRFRFAEKINKV